MAIGTQTHSAQSVLWLVSAEHGTLNENNASPPLLMVGGKYVDAPTAVSSNRPVVQWLDQVGYVTPHLDLLLLDSQTTATGSGTGTIRTRMGAFKEMDVLLDITVATGGTSTADRTMSVFIDTQLDGTNWVNIGQFAGTGSVVTYFAHLSRNRSTTADINITADAGGGIFRAMGWGDAVRVRRSITGTNPSFSYRVWANALS